MADTKGSALTAKTTLVDADIVIVVDLATSPITTKHITYADLESRLRDVTLLTDLGTVTGASGDYLMVLDVSASPQALKRILISDIENATHAGDASGATLLTLQPTAISGKGSITVAAADEVLVVDTSASPQVLGKTTAQAIADLRTLAVSDISGLSIVTADSADYVMLQDVSTSPHTLKRALVSDLGSAFGVSDITGAGAVTAAAADEIAIADASASPISLQKATAQSIANLRTLAASDITGQAADSPMAAAAGDLLLIADVSASPISLKQVTAQSIADLSSGLTNWEESGTTLRPKVAGYNLGDATNELGDVYLGDSKSLILGSSQDLKLTRDAANTLAQRNSTNAQTFNIYNTYTDASNYERGFLKWSANILYIGTEAAGTGTARAVQLISDSDSQVTVVGGAAWSIGQIAATAATNRLHDTGISWRRNSGNNITVGGMANSADVTPGTLSVLGRNTASSASTNVNGGAVLVQGGASATGSGNGGAVTIRGGTTTAGSVGNILMDTLPSADPGVAGALWKQDAGTSPLTYRLMVSAG